MRQLQLVKSLNPFTESVRVVLSDASICQYIVFDSSGREVAKGAPKSQTQETDIDLAGLKQGVYILKIVDTQYTVHHTKIVKG